jgi:phosphatidylserine/phosphatidylglycerophosphate/cardiolipin synthase-like enzyme
VTSKGPLATPIVEIGRNCWRIERANRAAVVIDAADYYHLVRKAMEAAQHRILLIGWDFDTRISLEPDPSGGGEELGAFMLRLAKANPARTIRLLKWSFGAYKMFLRPSTLLTLWRWQRTRAIEFRFDSAHPPGCSHHQKIVVIDDSLAVCGGIDTSTARWDTSEHRDDHPCRRLPNGNPYDPWHDITMIMDGPVAAALGDLGRDRWAVATEERLDPVAAHPDLWPDDIDAAFANVDIAIARTRAAHGEVVEVREIEALWLDMIAAATRHIYIENQYLTSAKVAAAIAQRMAEDDPPEIVIIMPRTADGWLEQRAMDAARVQLARIVARADRNNRFRIYVPVTAGGKDIYVHAKVAIIDDRLLRIGSANLNNRSFGLDSECDVVIDTALTANRDCGPAIGAVRNRLLAEHLGCSAEEVAAALEKTGSMIATIEMLSQPGRHLDLLDLKKPGPLDRFIAEHELLDPEHPEDFLEPLSERGLAKSWRKALRWRPRVRG